MNLARFPIEYVKYKVLSTFFLCEDLKSASLVGTGFMNGMEALTKLVSLNSLGSFVLSNWQRNAWFCISSRMIKLFHQLITSSLPHHHYLIRPGPPEFTEELRMRQVTEWITIISYTDVDCFILIIKMIMVIIMTTVMTMILQETDGVLLESYLIYEPEHQVIIFLLQQVSFSQQENQVRILIYFLSRPPGSRMMCLFWERWTLTKSRNLIFLMQDISFTVDIIAITMITRSAWCRHDHQNIVTMIAIIICSP